MSLIQWTDITSNPIHLSTGGHWCHKISPGCANCYAEKINRSDFFKFASHLPYEGKPPENLVLDEKILSSWSRLKKPQKIFVCSMTDPFGGWVPSDWQLRIFRAMEFAPRQTFQLLTKRTANILPTIDRYLELYGTWVFDNDEPEHLIPYEYLSNVWFGTSIENSKTAGERVPVLARIPRLYSPVRFLSVEPLLEPIALKELDGIDEIDWVIVGGESGKGARTCQVGWIERIVEDCQALSIPVHVKQLGSRSDTDVKGKGGDHDDPAFPEHLKIREFPVAAAA
jgi:protein gp37